MAQTSVYAEAGVQEKAGLHPVLHLQEISAITSVRLVMMEIPPGE